MDVLLLLLFQFRVDDFFFFLNFPAGKDIITPPHRVGTVLIRPSNCWLMVNSSEVRSGAAGLVVAWPSFASCDFLTHFLFTPMA